MAELRHRRDAVRDVDLIELRLDSVRDPDVDAALAGRRLPVIVTCRPQWEGGAFSGSEDERRRMLLHAIKAGAEYIDVEWRARFDDVLASRRASRVVISSHDFDGVPPDLADRTRAMRATGADVIKIAVTAHRLSDCAPLLDLAAQLEGSGPAVLIAMGPQGIASRVLASRFGSAWSYAGDAEHLGQVPSATLISDYRFRELSDRTAVYGVFGLPVGHSVSPPLHNAALREAGIDAVYLPLPAIDAEDAMQFGRRIGLAGASVTIPHKVALLGRMDDVDPLARRIGAINTITVDSGRWIGGNTDVAGFLRPLQDRGIGLNGQRAAILGAGGSARAVAVALASEGTAVTVYGRTPSAVAAVAAVAGGEAGGHVPAPGSWDMLVNCTPVGMHPASEASPLDASALTGRLVYDLVYNPTSTKLLRDAASAGCQTIGGLEMLVAQAEAQFHRWTGMTPARGLMQREAERRLREFVTHADHVV